LQIRLASVADTDALVSLVNSVYRGESSRVGWTTEADLLDGQRTDRDALQDFLSRSPDLSVMLVGIIKDQIIACLQLEHLGDEAHLGMLSVQASDQRQGLGRQMISAAEQHARWAWHARYLTIDVIHLRHELIEWYRRRGFELTGERHEFPYGDARFGLPKRDDLWFISLCKTLSLS
jgi:ribosomal protein S18 acetylase RimI-like enzyme